jgi:hypothetical protein
MIIAANQTTKWLPSHRHLDKPSRRSAVLPRSERSRLEDHDCSRLSLFGDRYSSTVSAIGGPASGSTRKPKDQPNVCQALRQRGATA